MTTQPTPRQIGSPGASLRRMASAVLLVFTLAAAGTLAAAEAAQKNYAIPAGNAGATLKQFAAQSGEQLLYAAAQVEGVKTNPVSGKLTARQALDAMVAGTPLTVTQDKGTGALAVTRAAVPNAPRAAQTVSDAPGKVEDGKLVLETYEVTGSRIRLNSGENPVQPVLTFTSLDIERTGASNLGQLFQYIPAVTSYTTGLGTEAVTSTTLSGNVLGQTGARTSAQIRGGTQTETLLLVDGRRVPLTGLRNSGGNGYDLGGIPLSAIERVEVLLDGASAIYGADALNGVINVILKKRYAGTQVQFTYDNTFDKDAAIKTASLTHGFARGKWSGLVTLSASENNIMLLADRYLTRSFDRTLYGGITNQSQPTLYVEGTGSLNVASGNLPGTTTPRVSIPAGYAGGTITVGDYAGAPAPVAGITPGRQGSTNYSKHRSGYVRLGYQFNDRLTLTGSVRLGRTNYRDNGQWRSMQNVTIPAGYAGNPFGVPVRLSKTFYDLPPLVSGADTANDEFTVAVEGKLPRNWRYEAHLTLVQGTNYMVTPELAGAGGQIGIAVAPASLFTTRLNAEIAAGRNPILIYDSNQASPNAANALDAFWVNSSASRLNDKVHNWSYAAQADGALFTLPAGEVKTVVGGEMREEYVDFPGTLTSTAWAFYPQRNVVSFFAETRIPIFSQKQKIPLLHQLDFNLAARTEDYSDFGRATTPRYGIAWRPFKAVMVRGSYGEGFLAPQLYRIAQSLGTVTFPASTIAILYAGQVDLSRGNAPITGPLDVLGGGNPALTPQLSQNWTYGVVLDVPKVKGLSLSFDYYDNKYTNGFGGISSMMDRQLYAPATVFRGPKLATDPADWLGPIIGYDARTINIARSRSAGYSFGARYQRSTAWGDFTFYSMGERTLAREERILPSSAPTASVAKKFVPTRITTSVTWSRGAWDAGVTNVYGGKYWVDSSNTALYPSRNTDDVMRWDCNVGYDFGRRRSFGGQGDSWWKRGLHDTKLRLTVIDVLDTQPPLTVNGAFSSSIIDPRLRRYVLDLTKRF